MNNVDDIGTMQENKEVDDLMNSKEMKDLDDLLESIEDREEYYTEIFDTLMTVWKRRELEGHQELQRGNYRTRSLQQPVSSPKREIIEEKCETIHEESEASNRDVASETKYEESQASKGEIAKQLEGVLNK